MRADPPALEVERTQCTDTCNVILCGRSGTRLWPVSWATFPKQYWAFAGNGQDTLLQRTHQQLEGNTGLESQLLMCGEDHSFIEAEQMRQIVVEPRAILLELIGRNTAPAPFMAALQDTMNWDDPPVMVRAAENVIREAARSRQALEAGMPAAEAGSRRPSTSCQPRLKPSTTILLPPKRPVKATRRL